MTLNSDVELAIAKNISHVLRKLGVLREGYQCEVNLLGVTQKKRKPRQAEFERNWDPDTDSVRIAFSPMKEEIESGTVSVVSDMARTETDDDRMLDLLRALDRAESRPGYEFISLKWFRDTALLHEGFAWASDEGARHNILREAIDRKWVTTRKVANPRPPNFPVTAIALNRLMPEVNAALGKQSSGLPAFRPVKMRGEPLSATVLHDRR